MPLIYWGEDGSHLPPKEVPEGGYGRLLKGFLVFGEADFVVLLLHYGVIYEKMWIITPARKGLKLKVAHEPPPF